MRRALAAAAVVVLVGACGGDDDADDVAGTVPAVSTTDGPPEPEPTTSPAPTPPEPSTSFSATPLRPESSVPSSSAPGFPLDQSLPLVTAAVEDLAQRLAIEPDAVTVVDARWVTWPDSSLGCPQPGMQYLQVLVDGTLVVLETNGRRYEYHGGDPLALCENPKPPSGG
jgi:hypothetical protein